MKMIFMLLLYCLPSVWAQTVTLLPQKDTLKNQSWIFLGLDAGPAYLNASLPTELNKWGIHSNLKGLYSHYFTRWVFDVGAGWFVNHLDGNFDNVTLVDDKVTTWGALLEGYVRLRHNRNYEFGVQNLVLMGTDTTFRTLPGENEHVTVLGGLQGVYTFGQRFPKRLSLSLLTDYNVSDRQLYALLIGFQWGFGIKPLIQNVFTRQYQDPVVIVSFDIGTIQFDFDSDVVKDESKKILYEFSRFLVDESKQFRMLRIEGHTDSRGGQEYNKDLSQRRAKSVKNIVVQSGLEEDQVEALGFGEERPLLAQDSEVAWEKNRRVELIFDGVKRPERFVKKINELKKRYKDSTLFPPSKN